MFKNITVTAFIIFFLGGVVNLISAHDRIVSLSSDRVFDETLTYNKQLDTEKNWIETKINFDFPTVKNNHGEDITMVDIYVEALDEEGYTEKMKLDDKHGFYFWWDRKDPELGTIVFAKGEYTAFCGERIKYNGEYEVVIDELACQFDAAIIKNSPVKMVLNLGVNYN